MRPTDCFFYIVFTALRVSVGRSCGSLGVEPLCAAFWGTFYRKAYLVSRFLCSAVSICAAAYGS